MINRLSEIDLPRRLAAVSPPWLTATATGLAFVGAAVAARLGIEAVAPGVVPFALLFPAILLATLLSGWIAGVVTLALGAALSWRFVMAQGFSLVGKDAADLVSLALFAAAGALIIAFAQAFRLSARRISEAQRVKLEERELLLRELNHRVSNNFQIVASVLELQLRRADGEGRLALEAALGRIRSIAEAHHDLYSLGGAQEIDMRDYLDRLCTALSSSLLDPGAIELKLEAEPLHLGRDRAVSLGLVVNELVTNAAKHAFPDQREGTIRIHLSPKDGVWRLLVADDGVGLPGDFARRGGLGWGIVRAFARRAGATIKAQSRGGAHFELSLGRDAVQAAPRTVPADAPAA